MSVDRGLKNAFLVVIAAVLICSCSREADEGPGGKNAARKKKFVLEEGFCGWNSLTLRSSCARLDVVPELGGKIMGYDLMGYQILWHDKENEGLVDTEQGYGFGEKFFNPGGAKVWPAPQGWGGPGEWPGPPDDVLDAAPYEFAYDDSSVTVISPKDTGKGRTGLRFKHTYSLEKSSSVVNLDLSMTNVVDRPVRWALWHLATVPVDRNFTVYVPVDEGDWHVIYGDEDNPQWLGVKDGIFRARYDKRVGKVGMKVREGWAVWYDEDRGIAFAMMFPVEKGAEYPDGGSNFEIWTGGAGTIRVNGRDYTYEYDPSKAMMELEVMGPLTRLAPGRSASMKVRWGACRCSGVKRVVPGGIVSEELKYDKEKGITGKFGVFYNGYLETVYLDKNGKRLSIKKLMGANPFNEVVINQSPKHIITFRAEKIRFQVTTADRKITRLLGEVRIH